MTAPCPETAVGNDVASFNPPRAVRGLDRAAWRRTAIALTAVVFVGVCARLAYVASEHRGVAAERAQVSHRLDLFASATEGVIKRLERVPATVQLNHNIVELLHAPDSRAHAEAASAYLRRLNAHLGSIAAFVLNDRGVVLASSNSEQGDDSAIGEDLSFRPYFLEALSGRVGHHFAIGIKRKQPGYFVSHPIHDGARVVGVAAIKISLDAVDQTWDMLGSPALLADTNGVVVMSSNPAWRYTSLTRLPLERRVDLQLTRTYDNLRIPRFPLATALTLDADGQLMPDAANDLAAPAAAPGMLVVSRTLDGMDWRLLLFHDLRPVRQQAVAAAFMAAGAAGFLLLLALHLAQRRRIARQKLEAKHLLERANAELEANVARRTQDLTETNARLRNEVQEREQAEASLRAAHSELVQAAKMAVLGRLAAGITHELTQPLGAIRTLSGNAQEFLKRGDFKALSGNLNIIERLTDQMGGIITPLKGFARKSQPLAVAVDIGQAVANTLFLYGLPLRQGGIEVDNRCGLDQVFAWCDANRLEQVLINLVGNAIDAMANAPVRRLTLRAALQHDGGGAARICIDVFDTGSGLSEQAQQQIFEPFFTTKPRGAGLGLGLAISRDIVHEFDGEIEGTNRADGGAHFRLQLPAAPVRLVA